MPNLNFPIEALRVQLAEPLTGTSFRSPAKFDIDLHVSRFLLYSGPCAYYSTSGANCVISFYLLLPS